MIAPTEKGKSQVKWGLIIKMVIVGFQSIRELSRLRNKLKMVNKWTKYFYLWLSLLHSQLSWEQSTDEES